MALAPPVVTWGDAAEATETSPRDTTLAVKTPVIQTNPRISRTPPGRLHTQYAPLHWVSTWAGAGSCGAERAKRAKVARCQPVRRDVVPPPERRARVRRRPESRCQARRLPACARTASVVGRPRRSTVAEARRTSWPPNVFL